MTDDEAYEHYRRRREEAAARVVELIDSAEDFQPRVTYREGDRMPYRVIDVATIGEALAEYRYNDAMMDVYKDRPLPRRPKRKNRGAPKDHIWRKDQIRGRAARNKGR